MEICESEIVNLSLYILDVFVHVYYNTFLIYFVCLAFLLNPLQKIWLMITSQSYQLKNVYDLSS